jgi:hypothetical protein
VTSIAPLYKRLFTRGVVLTPGTELRAVEGSAVVVANGYSGAERRIEGVDTSGARDLTAILDRRREPFAATVERRHMDGVWSHAGQRRSFAEETGDAFHPGLLNEPDATLRVGLVPHREVRVDDRRGVIHVEPPR